MPTPDTHAAVANAASDLLTTAGGAGVLRTAAGYALREFMTWLKTRGKDDAEAEKLSAEAQRIFNAMVDERVRMVLEADQKMIESGLETIRLLRARVEWQSNCLDKLRNALIGAGVAVPAMPAFIPPDAEDEN